MYSYGPFESQLLSDLDLVEHWGCVSINRVNDFGGYRIRPTENVDSIRDKAEDFLDDKKTKNALDDLVSTYGHMTARDLELRATTVYVVQDFKYKKKPVSKELVCDLVKQIKMKFDPQEIEQTVEELWARGHIQLDK